MQEAVHIMDATFLQYRVPLALLGQTDGIFLMLYPANGASAKAKGNLLSVIKNLLNVIMHAEVEI